MHGLPDYLQECKAAILKSHCSLEELLLSFEDLVTLAETPSSAYAPISPSLLNDAEDVCPIFGKVQTYVDAAMRAALGENGSGDEQEIN